MSLLRRDVLRALASVGVVGCAAPPPDAAPVEEPPPDVEPVVQRSYGPREHLADGPPAQHLLLVDSGGMGGSSSLSVYADGLALFYRREGMRTHHRRPRVYLLRLDAAELRDLRGILDSPGFAGAASSYASAGLKDGGATKFVAGAHRVSVHGGVKNIPPELADLRRRVDELEQRLEDRGQDAFTAAEPRLLTIYERWHVAGRTADRLIVWANGTLDYRVIQSADPDAPVPIVRLEQAAPPDLAELSGLLADGSFTAAPPVINEEADLVSAGTTHRIFHPGPTIAETAGTDPPADLRPAVDALARLLERFGAPPNEATVMPPKKSR